MKNLILISLMFASYPAFSTEPTDEVTQDAVNRAEVVVPPTQQKADIDDEIKNPRLRAATGSKKKLSIRSSFSYSGAAVTNPLSTERPQLNPRQASADPTRLNSSISLKYRATEHDNINLGFGIDHTPSFVRNRTTGRTEPARTNASSPYLEYQRTWKSGEFQNVVGANLKKYTYYPDVSEEGRNLFGQVSLSHDFMYRIPSTKFEIGNMAEVSQEIYNSNEKGGRDGATLYQFQFDPVLEYAFTEKLFFRTVYRMITYTTTTNDRWTAEVDPQTQSAGLGYSVSRDIYVFPNIAWSWVNPRADQTTIRFSAFVNL